MASSPNRLYTVNCSFKISHDELEEYAGRPLLKKTANEIADALAYRSLGYIDETLEEFINEESSNL